MFQFSSFRIYTYRHYPIPLKQEEKNFSISILKATRLFLKIIHEKALFAKSKTARFIISSTNQLLNFFKDLNIYLVRPTYVIFSNNKQNRNKYSKWLQRNKAKL